MAHTLESLMTKGTKKKRKRKGKGHLTAEKAEQMLHDNSAQGHPLTKPQRGYFGAVASGKNRK